MTTTLRNPLHTVVIPAERALARESRNPGKETRTWIPASAGMTLVVCVCFAAIFLLLTFAFPLLALAQPKPSWQQDWEKTVEAAKKEGEVHVYISGWGGVLESGQFQKAFPEIKVVAVTGKGAQIAQRVMSERRAGRFLADVVSDGINPVLTMF